MSTFLIGLDFGASQTKACIYNVQANTRQFFKFPNHSFFFPSQVSISRGPENHIGQCKFQYGAPPGHIGAVNKTYSYFKMAAVEDDVMTFNIERVFDNNATEKSEAFYNLNDLTEKQLTPEFLCVVYITYVLLLIKESIRIEEARRPAQPGILGQVQANRANNDPVFFIQLGIPTEWSHSNNLRRKRKFETILLLSQHLQSEYANCVSFQEAQIEVIFNQVTTKQKQLRRVTRATTIEQKLNENRLSVYPETAAGLNFILQTGQLNQGCYAILDIGAGTSDLSFFEYRTNPTTVRYYAAENKNLAANNVYFKLGNSIKSSPQLKQVEKFFNEAIKKQLHIPHGTYLDTILRDVSRQIDHWVYLSFNAKVANAGIDNGRDLRGEFHQQPLIIFGGGALLPVVEGADHNRYVSIRRYGNPLGPGLEMHLERKNIREYTDLQRLNILQVEEGASGEIPLLAVALGLSFFNGPNAIGWNEVGEQSRHTIPVKIQTDVYQTKYRNLNGDEVALVAHPINEDCYLYDVIERRFFGQHI